MAIGSFEFDLASLTPSTFIVEEGITQKAYTVIIADSIAGGTPDVLFLQGNTSDVAEMFTLSTTNIALGDSETQVLETSFDGNLGVIQVVPNAATSGTLKIITKTY